MMVEIGGMAPLLQVFDMPRAVGFYRDVLGFAVMQSAPGEGDAFDWCLLERGNALIMLNTAYEAHERPAAPDPARVKAHGDTGLFFNASDLDAIRAHLTAHGIVSEPPQTQAYGMRQLYVRDPDGYVLCFQHAA